MNKLVSHAKVKYETLVLVWASLLISQVLFFVVVYSMRPELRDFDPSKPLLGKHGFITVLFAVAAIVVFVLSFPLRNQHIRRSIKDQDAGCVQTALVLGCTLSELAALLGVVLAFVFDYEYFFLWIGLGMLGVLLHFPRRGNLLAATSSREQI